MKIKILDEPSHVFYYEIQLTFGCPASHSFITLSISFAVYSIVK